MVQSFIKDLSAMWRYDVFLFKIIVVLKNGLVRLFLVYNQFKLVCSVTFIVSVNDWLLINLMISALDLAKINAWFNSMNLILLTTMSIIQKGVHFILVPHPSFKFWTNQINRWDFGYVYRTKGWNPCELGSRKSTNYRSLTQPNPKLKHLTTVVNSFAKRSFLTGLVNSLASYLYRYKNLIRVLSVLCLETRVVWSRSLCIQYLPYMFIIHTTLTKTGTQLVIQILFIIFFSISLLFYCLNQLKA